MRRVLVHEGPATGSLRDAWTELAAADPRATPFQSPEWVHLWHARLAPRARLRLSLVYEGDDLVGLLPMAEQRGLWTVRRPAGVGPSDYLAPLLRPEGAEETAAAFADHLTDAPDADLVDLHQIPARHPLAVALGGSPTIQAVCLRIALPPTYDAFVKGLGKSLRYDVRRLGKLGEEFVFEDVATPDEFLTLHAERWRKRGLPGAFVGRLPAFHREWCALAHGQGWLRMSVLRRDGVPIGALYAMTYGRRTFFYQSGFAPAEGGISPGTLLVARTIRSAIEDGSDVFDLMRGDEPYKRRWKPTEEEANVRFMLPGRGRAARAAESWNRAAAAAEARVRARLEGRGLLA